MIRYLLPAALLAALGLMSCPAADKQADSDSQKLVYLGDRGPVLIELHLRIDGKSFRAVHRAFFDKLFDHLDRNRDGVLSREEAAAAPDANMLTSPLGLLLGLRGGRPPSRQLGRDGQVTRADLAASYGRAGLLPFLMADSPTQNRGVRTGPQNNEPPAEQLTDRLFALLDTDRDGQLSRKELEAAPALLGKLDVDEDEMLSTAELMGEAGSTDPYAQAFLAQRRPRIDNAPRRLLAAGDGRDEVLAQALRAHYGKRAPEDAARFAAKKADVSLTVHLGDRAGKPVVELPAGQVLPAGVQARTTQEGATLQLGTARMDLAVNQPINMALPANLRNQLKTRFRQADANSDGFLDRMEARRIGFGNLFEAMDRDGDGKVSEKEMLAWFDQIETLRQQFDRSCVSLATSNQGKGLFEMLDSNGDGKLSVRELRNAHKVLARLDRNGDGKLARTEVPRHDRTTLALGPNGGRDPLGRAVVAPRRGGPMVRGGRGSAARGPLWFQKMDRNRDGDVSRKEFLGTDEQFRQIDTDGDGLISVEEAERYQRRKDAGKE
jgi:Ca2+-binding EF-hand superfamily protein